MVQYVEGHCPNCGRPIRIRTKYFGKKLICKSCDFRFRPEPPDGLPAQPPLLTDLLTQPELDLDPGPEGAALGAPPGSAPNAVTGRDFQAILQQYDPLEAELRIKPSYTAPADSHADALAVCQRLSVAEREIKQQAVLSTGEQRLAAGRETLDEERGQHHSRGELLQQLTAAEQGTPSWYYRQAEELARQLNQAGGDAEQHGGQSEELRRRLESAVSQLEQAQSEIRQQDQREAALVNQLASVQKEVDCEHSRADELERALASARAELVELRGREPEFHARLQVVQQTLTAVRAEVAAQRVELDGAVADVQARELAALQEVAAQLIAAREQPALVSGGTASQ
jgi:hypothetical protein